MSVREYYDTYWSPEICPGAYTSPQFLDMLDTRIDKQTRVLDFGCGDGELIGSRIAPRAGAYLGLDVSETAVAACRRRGLEARRIESESALGVDSGSFDLALALEVLEHVFAPQVAARELHDALRPGGTLIATVPNVAYWRRRLGIGLGRWNPGGDELSVQEPWRDPHIRFFTASSLQRMLESSGFEEITVSGHRGALLADLPLLNRLARKRGSGLYRRLESRFPSLLGAGLIAVARKG